MFALALVAALPAEAVLAQAGPPPVAASREARIAQIGPGRCDGSRPPEAAGIVGALVGLAADFVVGWIGNAIKAHNAGLTGSFLATGVGTVTQGPACLRIYRGPITADGVPAPEQARGKAAFYFEADISTRPGATGTQTWTVTPWNLSYRTSVAATKSKTKNVSVVISFVDTTPTAATDPDKGKVLAVFRHDLGELEVGKTYNAGLLSGSGSANTVGKLGTYNIAALVTESKEPGPAMQALASSFNNNKSELSGALADVIKSAIGEKK